MAIEESGRRDVREARRLAYSWADMPGVTGDVNVS